MNIRRAKEKDINNIINLLQQVLEIHAKIRPDIFVSGTTKYSEDELATMINDDSAPIFAAVDENDELIGYAFCVLKEQPTSPFMVPFKSIYIDDLCVDSNYRGQHIGEQLFDFIKEEAKRLCCYEISLNVWAGNDSAEAFYEKMGMKTQKKKLEYIL